MFLCTSEAVFDISVRFVTSSLKKESHLSTLPIFETNNLPQGN